MSKKKVILKWSIITFIGLVASIVLFGYWFINLLPPRVISQEELQKTVKGDLTYLSENVTPNRGKILAVVTSSAVMGSSGKSTGFELTELSRTYYVFEANGFEVDVASPLGGNPPVVIDDDDMKEFDYAFLNDTVAQGKIKRSIALPDVNPDLYDAIFFVGGKGAMFDFPENTHIQSIVRDYYESGKVIGAVCHGPAALVNVTLSSGEPLIANKTISSFTNEEELLLIADAEEIFPFLLQNKLVEQGAQFNEGSLYLNQVSQDENVITGQNPWSTWTVAESIIEQLGYEPKKRKITPEEYSINILGAYEDEGYDGAKVMIRDYSNAKMLFDREILAVHSIVAAMQFKFVKMVNLIQLLSYSNSFL